MLISELIHELELCQERFKGEDMPVSISYEGRNGDREYTEDFTVDLYTSHTVELHVLY